MKDTRFTLSGDCVWICDMRPGLTEDGVSLTLPAGLYQSHVAHNAAGLASVEYLAEGRQFSREMKIGRISIDMARIGIVEITPLLARHGGDWAKLSDWSDEAAESSSTPWGGRLTTELSHAVFLGMGGDCEATVTTLYDGEHPVGFRVSPIEPKKNDATWRKWTWVEVKVRGFGDPWSFCDDWHYEPNDDQIYGDIDAGLSWECETSNTPDTRLAELSPKFKGVAWIKVFTEEASGQIAKPRKKLNCKIPDLPEFPTPRQLKDVIFALYKEARK